MTVTDILQQGYEELDSRESNGIAVTLVWRRMDDSVKVVVDVRNEERFEIDVKHTSPLEVFHHPFAYAAHRRASRGTERLLTAAE
jgi:hypothetical protein